MEPYEQPVSHTDTTAIGLFIEAFLHRYDGVDEDRSIIIQFGEWTASVKLHDIRALSARAACAADRERIRQAVIKGIYGSGVYLENGQEIAISDIVDKIMAVLS